MKKNSHFPMYKWCQDLFPICRSITGPGIKKTLLYFENLNKDFKRIKFKSKTKIFDWNVPLEWHIYDAYLEHENGKRFAEFKKNNLHIVNFSKNINKTMSKQELKKFIYINKQMPNAIPYVTSYYKKSWGFCMSYKDYKKMPEGNYKVIISSKFKKGFLDISHAILKGRSHKEIFFSSYVCHPSMANNELSGPVVLNALLTYIRKKYKKTKFTYRFVLLPETIGSIAYLSKYKNILKDRVFLGYVLSCLGDKGSFSIIENTNKNCNSTKQLRNALKGNKYNIYSYLERGSDERQYCSPNINLPISVFCRSKFHLYKEYHSSLDNLNIISQKNLQKSLEILIKLIDKLEKSDFPKNLITCEAKLSKRNLYPSLSKYDNKNPMNKKLKLRTNFLAYADGNRTTLEIAKLINENIKDVKKEQNILLKNKIISV